MAGATSADDRSGNILYDDDGGAEGGQTIGPKSPDAGDASDLRGNPLCHAGTYTSCFPDDTKSQYCALLLGDAGAEGGSPASACHVSKGGPECGTAGTKAEGEACTAASDCSAGFECVGTPARCRRYCCESSTCAAYGKNTGKDYFCDIQPLATATSTVVPVCQPVMPCNLLGDNCGQGQTCALVDANKGLTSCVSVGPAKVGESCAAQHCGAGLQCIGNPSTCHQLCDPKNPSCPMGQQCFLGWPTLQQQGVGVCQ
jgi:hypothetical protein